jgi:hypothetical protein
LFRGLAGYLGHGLVTTISSRKIEKRKKRKRLYSTSACWGDPSIAEGNLGSTAGRKTTYYTRFFHMHRSFNT